MVTLVGTQANFEDVIVDLIELEYDAIGAYKVAIEKLSDFKYKSKMSEFLADHERHIREIKAYYSTVLDLPDSADLVKGTMAKMKVTVANALGSDKTILKAMLDNELDTNTAYERVMQHAKCPIEANDIFFRAHQDEKKHKEWLESYTNS